MKPSISPAVVSTLASAARASVRSTARGDATCVMTFNAGDFLLQ